MKWRKLLQRVHRLNERLPGSSWPTAHTGPNAIGVVDDIENLESALTAAGCGLSSLSMTVPSALPVA